MADAAEADKGALPAASSGSTGLASAPPAVPIPTTFDYALAFVLRAEGVDSAHPADAGGRTRFGIAQASHPDVDVPSLTLAQACAIYEAHYWQPLQCDLLPRALAVVVFDCAVNQGPRVAATLLQQAAGTALDGKVGERTLLAARNLGASALLPRYQRLRAQRYIELVRAKPSQQVFLGGWLMRLFEGMQAALVMP